MISNYHPFKDRPQSFAMNQSSTFFDPDFEARLKRKIESSNSSKRIGFKS